MKTYKVGMIVFDDMEVLDFAAPFEVFSLTALHRGRKGEHKPFDVSTVSDHSPYVITGSGLRIIPDYNMDHAPHYDLIVIPGGPGIRLASQNKEWVGWIHKQFERVKWMTSVRTGVQLLAEAGIMDGKRATTHRAALQWMKTRFPQTTFVDGTAVSDEGRIITSADGMHLAFHMVQRLLGTEVAKDTARFMEYDIPPDPSLLLNS